jgi:hypothetical protein
MKGSVSTIIITAVITVIVTGGIFYYIYNQPNDSVNNTQISNNENQITNNNDEMADWKTYSNSVFGFSFKYPASYVIQDNLPGTWINNSSPSQGLSISDKADTNQPKMTLYLNPAGWGPVWTDISYNLSLNSSGHIVIDKRTVVPANEGNQDGKTLISTLTTSSFADNIYWILFSSKESSQNYEPIFEKILSTFVITQ